MVESDDEYDVGGDIPLADLPAFEAGQSLLLVGHPSIDQQSLGLRLVTADIDHDQCALIITFDEDVGTIIEAYRRYSEDDDFASLTVIDCSGAEQPPDDLPESQYLSVPSPSSLTDIGMSFIEYEDTRTEDFDGTRVLVDSITTLLEHVNEKRVFEFITAFIGRFESAEYLGVWTMDASAHDEQTVSTFAELFDRVIELRKEDGTEQYRIRDSWDDAAEWTSLSGN